MCVCVCLRQTTSNRTVKKTCKASHIHSNTYFIHKDLKLTDIHHGTYNIYKKHKTHTMHTVFLTNVPVCTSVKKGIKGTNNSKHAYLFALYACVRARVCVCASTPSALYS